MKPIIITLLLTLLISCTADADRDDLLIKTMVIGSAEVPDLVLEKVLALEKKGLVFNVIILESFPVQIHFEASQKVIDQVKTIKAF